MIQFILNNSHVKTQLASGSTILDFVRYEKRLTGTKTGCREGDCGACTVLVGQFEQGQLRYRSMTSCLMPLANAYGKHIVTVEGVNVEELSPAQRSMVETNGTQCGFCTIGFIMSFTSFVLHPEDKSFNKAIEHIDGNICRCTGYKSIERAAAKLAELLENKPAENTLEWLVENRFLPSYFCTIGSRLSQLQNDLSSGSKSNGILQIGEMTIGGCTDLLVQKHAEVKHSSLRDLLFEQSLKGIESKDETVIIGASTTVTEFAESLVIKNLFPKLKHHVSLVSSTPIRNMATLAGNLVNASPIGDMTVFLLALNAHIVLSKSGTEREIPLRQFYKGYKITDKLPGEIISKIKFQKPSIDALFSFEKVCKRTFLDIASVNSACLIQLDSDNRVEYAFISAGGVFAYPLFLEQTSTFLKGKKLENQVVKEAFKLLQQEIKPISDARGSSEYKRVLLRQLVLGHFEKAGFMIQKELWDFV